MRWLTPALRSTFAVFVVGTLAACSEPVPVTAPPPLVKLLTVQESVGNSGASTQPATSSEDRLRISRAELSGEIVEVLVQAGSTVRAGQALLRINPRDARLADSAAQVQIQAAKAELATAEADFARYTQLRDQSFISQAEWERRQTMLTLARAQYEASLEKLGLYSVRALADSRIDGLTARQGQAVEAGTVLARLTPLRPQARGAVAATATTSAGMSASAPGSTGVTPTASNIRGLGSRGSIWVPLTAVVDGNTVMVAELRTDGQWEVRAQAIVAGQSDGQRIRIADGLHPGEQIVAVGGHLLTPGQRVRVAP
jgi:multidrug efflux system membrane fusion protein